MNCTDDRQFRLIRSQRSDRDMMVYTPFYGNVPVRQSLSQKTDPEARHHILPHDDCGTRHPCVDALANRVVFSV